MLAAPSLAWGRAPGTKDARIQPEPAFLRLVLLCPSTPEHGERLGQHRELVPSRMESQFCARLGENWTRWFKLSCPSNPGRIGYICLRGCHRAGIASKGPPRHPGHDSICALLGLGTGEPWHPSAWGARRFPRGVCMSRLGSTAANTGRKSPVAPKRSPPSAKTTATPPWARARVPQPPPRSGCCSPASPRMAPWLGVKLG